MDITLQTNNDEFQLQTFKTILCPFKGNKHNPKQCIFYHNQSDRKRINHHCSDLCQNSICNDDCLFAHNRVEQLYSEEKFKTKYCQFYPNNLQECPYQSFCSFVHNESEFRIQLLHKEKFDFDFFVYKFKTVLCPYTNEHNRQHCVYAHNPQDFRRVLYENNTLKYESEECQNWNKYQNVLNYKEGGCNKLNTCKYSHGWKESDYHINLYKTRQCNDGKNCKFKDFDCPFWHSLDDRKQIKKFNKQIIKSSHKQKYLYEQYNKPTQVKQIINVPQSSFNSQSTSDQDEKSELDEQRQEWKNCLKLLDEFITEGQIKIQFIQNSPLRGTQLK